MPDIHPTHPSTHPLNLTNATLFYLLFQLLESTVPDIEGLVVAAGRSDWNHHKSNQTGGSLNGGAGGGAGGGGGEKGMKGTHRAPITSSSTSAVAGSHPYSDSLHDDHDNNYTHILPRPPAATATTATYPFVDGSSTNHDHPHLDGTGD